MYGPRVAVSATFTADLLRAPMEFLFGLLRWRQAVEFAPFAQVFQALLDPAGLFAGNTGGINVVLVRAEDLAAPETRASFVEAVRSAAEHHDAHLLIAICASVDADCEVDLSALAPMDRVTVLEDVARRYPVAAVHDARMRALGAIPYTEEYFAALALLIARTIHGLRAAAYKVIALDCDDTLWSGVCGEDGPGGIVLDAPRRMLQEFMAEQRRDGRLLAIASKNNEADVIEAFRQNPEMPLRLEHFAARRINWEGKAVSLQALADELSLGLDSFVFVDDNPKETAEVAAEIPEAVALALPANAQEIPEFLNHVWALDAPLAITAEDRGRTAAYAERAERNSWERQARNLEEFIGGLRLRVEIRAIEEWDLARAAQLTQRTNQMNFSTKRRREAEIRAFAETGLGYVVAVRDRFGDYGSVGLVLLEEREGALEIDTFLLSCRALGRGVEHRMLRHVGEVARDRGLNRVVARFEETRRNAPAKEFLETVPQFGAAELAQLAYEPSRTIPRRKAAAGTRQVALDARRAPDYQRIAELPTPGSLLRAVREQKRSAAAAHAVFEAPRTELERRLCAIWSEWLAVPRVGIHDNFFDLGGHSLLAVQLVARLQKELAIELPLEAVYTGTLTVAELARSIELFQLGEFDQSEYASLLAEIQNLSDEEAEALLAREMSGESRP